MNLVRPSYKLETLLDRSGILRSIEMAGRTCYKSEGSITEDSSSKFVKFLVEKGHLSVIEHVVASVRFIVDRGVTHELVRHRLASYSQESTRYCNYKGGVTFIIPPWVDVELGEYRSLVYREGQNTPSSVWYNAMAQSELYYCGLLKRGWSPQEARSVLPNSLKTEIVMTANVREWLHVFKMRCSEAAHPQMREIMIPLRNEFRKELPEIFGRVES